jgi:DNA-directed RNA polymerase specialized sigma24 family protein
LAADAAAYFLGVARNVLRESWARRAPPETLTDEHAARLAGDPQGDEETARQEAWASCLDRCLERLPLESRQLVLLYHQDQQRARIDGRRELARRLGIGLNALRIRVFRLRAVLETCVKACVSRPGGGK